MHTDVLDSIIQRILLDKTTREDQVQVNQMDERLASLTAEYHRMKVQFEEQIQSLEERTAQLLVATGITEKKVLQQTPDFQRLQEEYAQATKLYDAAKEAMIEIKRKKQDKTDKTTAVQQAIREKIRARDVSMLAVKECQRDTQERMQNAHEATIRLEKDIYEKGCRLEMLDTENERFRQVTRVVCHVIFNG